MPRGRSWRKAGGHAHFRSRRQNAHASPEGSGLSLTRADMLPPITARTQTRPHLPSRRAWYDPLARRELGGQPPRTVWTERS